eukprot:gene10580-12309_t
MYCNSTADCYYHGNCIQNQCVCHSFVFDRDNCRDAFEDVLGNSFTAFRLFFLVIIVIITFITIYSAYKSFLCWRGKKVAYKLKAINHLFVLFFCLLRIIYFSADPWGSQGKIPYALSKFLYAFPIYVLFSAYELLLIYWAGSYHNVSSLDNGHFFVDKTAPAFLVSNSIWFAFEVIRMILSFIDLGDSTKMVNQVLSLAYNIFLPTNKDKKQKTLRKLLITTVAVSGSIFCVIVPSIIFFLLNFQSHPNSALAMAIIVHTIEIALVVELLFIMKPKATMPFASAYNDQEKNNSLRSNSLDHKARSSTLSSSTETLGRNMHTVGGSSV